MKDWIKTVPLKEIIDLLPNEFKQKITKDSLKELDESKRKSLARKRFYKLRAKNNQFIHLTYGKYLTLTFENSQSLYKVLPEITCKPLFIKNKGDISLIAYEYFDGKPIDQIYLKKEITESNISIIFTDIHNRLKKLEKPSITHKILFELDAFFNDVI
jgi:hypothetical protein